MTPVSQGARRFESDALYHYSVLIRFCIITPLALVAPTHSPRASTLRITHKTQLMFALPECANSVR